MWLFMSVWNAFHKKQLDEVVCTHEYVCVSRNRVYDSVMFMWSDVIAHLHDVDLNTSSAYITDNSLCMFCQTHEILNLSLIHI